MLVGNEGYEPLTEVILAEEILEGNASQVIFSSLDTLAAGYKHLQVRITARVTQADSQYPSFIQLNGDTGVNYSYHRFAGYNAGGVTAARGTADANATHARIFWTTAANAPANAFGAAIVDILDPFETTKFTTMRGMTSVGYHADPFVGITSGLWINTDAVTSIRFAPFGGSNYVAGSRFTLVGVK